MKLRFHDFFLSTAFVFAILPNVASGAPSVANLEISQASPPSTTPLLRPIASTRTLPPWPPLSVELKGPVTTLMEVNITTEGNANQCYIIASSSSEALDQAACDHVKGNWRWEPPIQNGTPIAVRTRVSMRWLPRDNAAPLQQNIQFPQAAPWAHSPRVMPPGVFLKSAVATGKSRIKCTFSDGVIHEVENRNDCFKTADAQFGSVNQSHKLTQQSQKSLADFKEQCIAYGYKKGTPAAAECVMKLDLAQQQENRLTAEREAGRQNSAKEMAVPDPLAPPQKTAEPMTAGPVADTPGGPIARTRTLPPYPPEAIRLNEEGTTLMEVDITTLGNVDVCRVVTSSSSQRLDTAACDHVKRVWRWEPPTRNGVPIAVKTRVSVKWDLKEAPFNYGSLLMPAISVLGLILRH